MVGRILKRCANGVGAGMVVCSGSGSVDGFASTGCEANGESSLCGVTASVLVSIVLDGISSVLVATIGFSGTLIS